MEIPIGKHFEFTKLQSRLSFIVHINRVQTTRMFSKPEAVVKTDNKSDCVLKIMTIA